MLFKRRRDAQHKGPEGYIFTLPPRSSLARSSQPTGVFLRARRRAAEGEFLPFIFLLFGGIAVGAFAFSGGRWLPWIVSVALGLSAFVLYVCFAYMVHARLSPHRRQLPASFMSVVLPGLLGLLASQLVAAIWFMALLYTLHRWSPVLLFLVLLGLSVALCIGKLVQWALYSLANRQALPGPSNRPL